MGLTAGGRWLDDPVLGLRLEGPGRLSSVR